MLAHVSAMNKQVCEKHGIFWNGHQNLQNRDGKIFTYGSL